MNKQPSSHVQDNERAVAVIGLACRFPGAPDVVAYQHLVESNRSAIIESPREWLLEQGISANLLNHPSLVSRFGVLEGVESFDADAFGIPPARAKRLDPQQRLLLELAVTALEHAGYADESEGGSIGVYVSLAHHSYRIPSGEDSAEGFFDLTASDKDYGATRISYALDLTGPSLTVQSACSGSLAAIHLAAEALISGQCDLALAGGCSILLPQGAYLAAPGLMLAADGHCRPYDADANGTVPGNGAGLVVLKRLDQAMADGDVIHAVILGSAMANDGSRKVDYLAPGVRGQVRAIGEAWSVAGVAPSSIGYIEGHGTGTRLGDPIEIEALRQVYKQFQASGEAPPDECWIGSCKGTLGHLNVASGVAGFIRAVLAVREGFIPGSPGFSTPNPEAPFKATPLNITRGIRPWTGHRRAGVSSFGFGGTNVHIVIEQAPQPLISASRPIQSQLIPLSASDGAGLERLRHALANHISAEDHLRLDDVAFTLQRGRRQLQKRIMLRALDINDLLIQLKSPGTLPQHPPKDPAIAEIETWLTGERLDWSRLKDAAKGQRRVLPTYPFARNRHWLDQAPSLPLGAAGHEALSQSQGVEENVSLDRVELPSRIEWLKVLFAQALDCDAARLSIHATYDELGVDSLLMVSLTGKIREQYPEVRGSLLFEFNTLAKLAAHLESCLPNQMQNPVTGSTASHPTPTKAAPASEEDEAIAIIGQSFRLPGASTPDRLSELLALGESAMSPVPPAREWPRSPNESTPIGGFIDEIDRFDALFFGIAPTEARRIDPQARLFLETAWASLEDAGYTPSSLKGRIRQRDPDMEDVGVFVGVMNMPYRLLAPLADQTHQVIQANHWSVANRVSYHFDFSGPSLAVDTACSASLTALHLACESIRRGECAAALVGGVNLILNPLQQRELGHLGLLSPTNTCHTFGAAADGFAQGEGVAAVVLKPLSAANADGDRILGLIRGSAANANGRTGGYTVPSPKAQTRVIRRALQRAKLNPADISVIECHGTGTLLGDPIEITGLWDVFAQTGKNPIAIGSIKSNMGHLESAAGLAGLAKVLLQLEKRVLFPSLHAEPLNSELGLESTRFIVPKDTQAWPVSEAKGHQPKPRRAGLSGFGAGGSNVHVVIEEAPDAISSGPSQWPDQPILLSATDPEALDRIHRRLIQYLEHHPALAASRESLADLAYTLATGREHLPIRAGFVAWDRPSLLAGLARSHKTSGPWEDRYPRSSERVTDWLRGDQVSVDGWWSGEQRHRLSLPTYPFKGPRLWFAANQKPLSPSPRARSPWIESAQRLDECSLSIVVNPPIDLMEQHLVNGSPCLPGVISATLAYAAAEALGLSPEGLAGLVFRSPICPEPDGKLSIRVQFNQNQRFQIVSAADGHIKVEGQLLVGEAMQRPTLSEEMMPFVIASSAGQLDQAAVRQRLNQAGLQHGPLLRSIEQVSLQDDEIVAFLSRPDLAKDQLQHWHPCPSLLDSALQAACLLLLDDSKPIMPIPMGLDQLWFIEGNWPDEICIKAHLIERSEGFGRLNLCIMDGSGKVLSLIKGLTARLLSVSHPPEVPLFIPFWEPAAKTHESSLIPSQGSVVILARAEDDAFAHSVLETLKDRVAMIQRPQPFMANLQDLPDCLLYIHTLEATPSQPPILLELIDLLRAVAVKSKPLRLILLTRKVHAIAGESESLPWAAAAIGLLRTAAQENPRLKVACLDLDDNANLNLALSTAPDPLGLPMAFRHGRPYQLRIKPLTLPKPRECPVSSDDHIFVVGGAGGIGRSLAARWVQQGGARITLVGRRPKESAFEDGVPASMNYLRVDVTDPEALAQAIREAERVFGPITGAVHAALIMNDAALHNMTHERFMPAFEVKRLGLYHLIESLAERRLRWIAVFSSVNSFITNPGQSNYVAGCQVMDAIGLNYARCKGIPVRIINWGYWGEVGRVASDEYRLRMERLGVHSIGVSEGLDALDSILSRSEPQVVALNADPPVMARLGLVKNGSNDHPFAPTQEPSDAFDAACRAARQKSIEATQSLHGVTLDYQNLDRLAVETIAHWWSQQPFPARGSRNEMAQALGLDPSHAQQFDALIDMLVRHGYLAISQQVLMAGRTPWPNATAIAKARATFLSSSPEFKAHFELLDACIAHYDDVLTATMTPTEVLFPDMSMARVEGMYRGNRMVDHFNTQLAAAVAGAQQRGDAGTSFKVLEFGSGTGGTTQAVLPALGPGASYDYTDISSGFLQYGKKQFKAAYPFLSFKLLDLERQPDPALFPPQCYDLAFGSNVIHATRNLGQSLEHVASLLRPGGLLILYEMVANHEFVTITFGLLPGWWLSEDSRLPHGPLLNPSAWRDRLTKCGFDQVAILGQPEAKQETDATHALIIARKAKATVQVETTKKDGQTGLLRNRLRRQRAEDYGHLPANLAFEQDVLRCVAESLEIPQTQLDPNRSLAEYGADSILSVQLIRNLNQSFGIELKPTTLFSYPTVRQLAAHVAAIQPTAPPPGPPDVTAARMTDTLLNEGIAIIGMAGRFPGADSLEDLRELLITGRSAVGPVPVERWDHHLLNDPDPLKAGHTVCPGGGFLNGVFDFDPVFFGLSPADAVAMDPQQRLFLMTAWNALEDAAITPEQLKGQPCGVYSGNVASDYERLLAAAHHPRNAQTFMGSAASMLPARIAYHLDLKGPALSIDTACSSSLVAIAEACEALKAGRCDTALAGGVALMATPQFMVVASNAGMLSSSGQCHTLDEKADGFVPGEAVSVFVLKRLVDALAEGHRIAAVIRGWGVNQDGASNGITAPSAPAQSALIRGVHERFSIDAATIDYVELHGTGTRLGDPVEVEGLSNAFGPARGRCGIGSVKTNLGHTLAAAGAVGLSKVVLALEAQMIPASLHFHQLNPAIELAGTPFYPVTKPTPWTQHASRPRRAGVSAFGFAGTNAHVVVEEPPSVTPTRSQSVGPWLFLLSAKTVESLQQRATDLSAWLKAHPDAELDRLAFTLHRGRAHFHRRAATITDDRNDLIAWLDALSKEAVRVNPHPHSALGGWAIKYLDGHPIPNNAFDVKAQIIPLSIPGYPFATRPYHPGLSPLEVTALAMPDFQHSDVPKGTPTTDNVKQTVTDYLDQLILETGDIPHD